MPRALTITCPGGALWKNGLVTPLLAAVPGAITFPTALFLSGQDVYVAGQYRDPVTELPVATYWKNGTPVTVGVSTYSELTSIWVQGSEVYLAGVDGACQYWKNDQITPLQSASGGPYPDAIAVTASGDVLVAGQDWDANGTSVAVLWTNGVPAFLPDTAQGSVATSLAVAGGTIVVGGMVSNGSADVATVWKNGVRTTLARPRPIATSGAWPWTGATCTPRATRGIGRPIGRTPPWSPWRPRTRS